MKKRRFSKQGVADYINVRLVSLELEYGFSREDGTNQVRSRTLEANRAYGEWDSLYELAEQFGIQP